MRIFISALLLTATLIGIDLVSPPHSGHGRMWAGAKLVSNRPIAVVRLPETAGLVIHLESPAGNFTVAGRAADILKGRGRYYKQEEGALDYAIQQAREDD